MKCFIYKSRRKQEMYLYIRDKDRFEELPEALRQQFGIPEFVMELELTPERKLAREDAEEVRRNLAERGYHLQMPPPDPTIQIPNHILH